MLGYAVVGCSGNAFSFFILLLVSTGDTKSAKAFIRPSVRLVTRSFINGSSCRASCK